MDPVFGTTIIRITDAGNPVLNSANDPSLSSLSWEDQTGNGNSWRAAWNTDQSLLMMEKGATGALRLNFTTTTEGRAKISGAFFCGSGSSRDDVDCTIGEVLFGFEIALRVPPDTGGNQPFTDSPPPPDLGFYYGS